MGEERRRQIRKWAIMGATGLVTGILSLALFRSLPMASGTAAVAVVSLIAAKHLALAVAAGSPLAALFRILQPKVRPYCPWAPGDKG
jgi:hypothetical protein